MSFYAEFDEDGFHVVAEIKYRGKGGCYFEVKATKDGREVKTIEVPMIYEPRFGVDVGDKAELERQTDILMADLKSGS